MITAVVKYTRADGSKGVALCDSRESGIKTADYYADQGWPSTIEVIDLCDECSGDGTRPHKRNALRRVKCATCKGKNSERLLETITKGARP